MKLKQLSAFSILLLISFIISSCATNHAVEKLLIGKWNPVHVENLAPGSYQLGAMKTIKVDTSTTEGTTKEIELTLPATPDNKEAKIVRYMNNEQNSPVLISITNNQRKVEKYFPGKTVSGTWKLKKKGKRLVVKETETGKMVTLDIVSLTDSTTVLIQKLPFGDIKIKYAKVK
jgi:hypothetical protein